MQCEGVSRVRGGGRGSDFWGVVVSLNTHTKPAQRECNVLSKTVLVFKGLVGIELHYAA